MKSGRSAIPIRRMPHDRILRIVVGAGATVVWSADRWATTNRMDAAHLGELDVWFADLPTG